MESGVIVLAPPWPRSGSGNIIAAQTAAHARRGSRVFLVLTPLDRWHRPSRSEFWRDAVAAMKFPGVETVAYPRTESGNIRSYCDWVLAGRDDSIAISARYAASGRLPGELVLDSARIDLIHANHVFSMRLAQRIAGIVEKMHGRRPQILLETHDIQSNVFVAGRRINRHSRRTDSYDALLRSELALCSQADALLHITQSDFDFFSNRLPNRAHELILPTLHPHSEAQLTKRRGLQRQAEFDFVYVGNNHEANLETVRWMLREVLLFANPNVRHRIRFIGTIGQILSSREPQLFKRYEHLFVGEMSSVFDFYAAAKAILAPATAGTGTSIKLIEALCVGKPVLTSDLALRGLPRAQMGSDDIHIHDTAGDFADTMNRMSDSSSRGPALSHANVSLYDRLFCNRRYFAALDEVIDARVGLRSERVTAHQRGGVGLEAGRVDVARSIHI